jgi:hypothetical protein
MSYLKHAIAVILLVPCIAGVSLAEERHRRDSHSEWHGEINRFHEHDMDLWRGGRWRHGRHEGRYGWWWIVGSAWYFYPGRVEPYPDPYQPPVTVVPPAHVPAQYWYYCTNPVGYYPYVARCGVNWQRVSATAPPDVSPR